MAQDDSANFYSFSDANDTRKITYYPLVGLEYQGPEGHSVYPSFSPGYEMMIQDQSSLGQQVTVVLVPSV